MMIIDYINEVTSIRQRLFMAAFSLGYECCAVRGEDDDSTFRKRMDHLLQLLVREIHPNVYPELRDELQRCSSFYDNRADQKSSSKPLGMFHSFVSRCDNYLHHEPSIGVWYRLGSEIGRACHLARTQYKIASSRYLFRQCVGLIPDSIRENDALNRIAIALENKSSDARLIKMITDEIPSECLQHFDDEELPYQALYKFVIKVIFSSDFESKVEFGDESETNGSSSIDENDAWYSDSPPPKGRFFDSPVCGTLSRISQALNMCPNTMKAQHDKWIWIRRLTRRKFDIYFETQHRYSLVARRMTDDSNESE